MDRIPFFVDLLKRTGKQAKHFRRLYSNATMCECGLFPVYAQQKLSSAPPVALPDSFTPLCLDCIWGVVADYKRLPCSSQVPGLIEQLYSDSMDATYEACYKDYHSDQCREERWTVAPRVHLNAATLWLDAKSERRRGEKARMERKEVKERKEKNEVVEGEGRKVQVVEVTEEEKAEVV